MDGDTQIKLIFATAMTIMYVTLFVTIKPDVATAIAIATAFTNTLTGVFVKNLTERKKKR